MEFTLKDYKPVELKKPITIGTVPIDDTFESHMAADLNLQFKSAGSLPSEANNFVHAIDSGHMLVKSVKTGNVKTIPINSHVVKGPVALDDFVVRNSKIVPRKDFSKADTSLVNIHAHKGPNETSGPVGGAL